MQEWLSEHKLISYLLILGFSFYIFYKVFRPQAVKLPLIRTIMLYITMLVGSFVLMILQVDKLPIVQCLGVAVLLMFILRCRQIYDAWKAKKSGNTENVESN